MEEVEEGRPPADGVGILRELERLKRELDELDDSVKRHVAECEGVLESLRLGVSLSFTVTHDSVTEEYSVLAFEKVAGRWRLVVRTGDADNPESVRTVPLADVDRDTRATMCLEQLPKMLESGAGSLLWRVRQRKDAIRAMKDWISQTSKMREANDSEKVREQQPAGMPAREESIVPFKANAAVESMWTQLRSMLQARPALSVALDGATVEEWNARRVVLSFPEKLFHDQAMKNRERIVSALSKLTNGPTILELELKKSGQSEAEEPVEGGRRFEIKRKRNGSGGKGSADVR